MHGYLLQERGMGTGLIEADLHGRTKREETRLSRGLWTGVACGGCGDCGTRTVEVLIVHLTIVPWVLELLGEEED